MITADNGPPAAAGDAPRHAPGAVGLGHLSPDGHGSHPLHASDAVWPETNCVIDVWIELLHALGLPAEPALAVAARQDFEGDQFTFTKIPVSDLEALYGLTVQELSIYEDLERHLLRQLGRGRVCLVELDPFYMPDTGQAAYRTTHGKTTIGVNRLEPARRRMEYFHNGGYFALEGEDYDALLHPPLADGHVYRPYAEYATTSPVRLDPIELRRRARRILEGHWARRPSENPIRRLQAVLPEDARALVGREPQAFHDYAFHTLRMLGGNFEQLAACLDWLKDGEDPRSRHCRAISMTAKSLTLQLARALARGRFDTLGAAVEPAAQAWDALFAPKPSRRRAQAALAHVVAAVAPANPDEPVGFIAPAL